jgi:N-methylhydantoinase A/oxoprolinase/acetone carboxylase beta subunit
VEAVVRAHDDIAPGEVVEGPAIVETPVTVVVVDPDATATRASTGALVLRRNGEDR